LRSFLEGIGANVIVGEGNYFLLDIPGKARKRGINLRKGCRAAQGKRGKTAGGSGKKKQDASVAKETNSVHNANNRQLY